EQAKRENAQLDARMREVTGDKLRKQIEDVQKQMLNLQAQYPGIFTKELDALDVLNDKLNRVGNNKELQILLAQANMELQRMKEIVEEIDINETIRPDSKIFADLMYEYSRLREDTRRYNR